MDKFLRKKGRSATEAIELEIKKTELKLLREKLQKETTPEKKGVLEVIKDISTILALVLAPIAGGWGLYEGVQKYFSIRDQERLALEEQRKFQYHEKMITVIDDLEKPEQTDRALMLLRYFSKDAIPPLLLKLEKTPPENSPSVIYAILQVIETEPDHKALIIERIRSEALKIFAIECLKKPDRMNIDAMHNYASLFLKLKEAGREDDIKSIYPKIREHIDSIKDATTKEFLIKKTSL